MRQASAYIKSHCLSFCSSYVYHQRHPFDSKQANGKMQSRKRFLRRIRNIHRRTRFVHRKFGDYNNVNSGVAQLYSDYFCRSDKHALSNTYAACVVIYIGIFGISRQPLGQKKYTLVSVLELVEQVCRIIACLVLLSTTLNKLYSTALSMSIACLGSAAAAAFFYIKDGGKITNPKKKSFRF